MFESPRDHPHTLNHICSFLGFALFIFSIFYIQSTFSFPGKWALFPTCGAFLIILAGKDAYFNRLFLNHSFSIFIGKISYSFYLWHWPILCYAKFYYGGTPPRIDRVILLFGVLILSYCTTRFVENPLRFGAFMRLKVTCLITTLLTLCALSALLWMNGEEEKNDFASQEWIHSWGNWRHFGNQNSNQRIILMGDSHVAHFEKQLIDQLGKTYAIDRIAGPCLVSKNQIRLAWEMSSEICQNMQQKLIHSNAADIVIVSYYLTGNKKMHSAEEFQAFILDVAALFEKKPSKLIVVGDPGNVDVLCEKANQSKWLKKAKKCTAPHPIEPYLNFKKWSQEKPFPAFIHFVYPFDLLCDQTGHCQAYGPHGRNFWDDNHLTYWGSKPVADSIVKIILNSKS